MTLIGVDLGYRAATTIAIVKGGKFQFRSICAGTEFHDTIQQIVDLMLKYDVLPENLSIPAHPAVEQKIKRMFYRYR